MYCAFESSRPTRDFCDNVTGVSSVTTWWKYRLWQCDGSIVCDNVTEVSSVTMWPKDGLWQCDRRMVCDNVTGGRFVTMWPEDGLWQCDRRTVCDNDICWSEAVLRRWSQSRHEVALLNVRVGLAPKHWTDNIYDISSIVSISTDKFDAVNTHRHW